MHRFRRPVRVVADAALVLASVAGVLCAVLALAGVLAGFGVILFRTGSMAPTIPAGSAALVRTVPASEVAAGDVVTVDRPGQLPVTHRVVSVAPVPGDGSARDLVLRGDANDAADPSPYRVESARRVIGSVPGVAPAIAWLAQPAVAVPVTLLMSALVVTAFWPRRASARGCAPRNVR